MAHHHHRRSRLSRITPWLVLTAGIILSIIGWRNVQFVVAQQDAARFSRLKELVIAEIEDRFRTVEEAIVAGRSRRFRRFLIRACWGSVSSSGYRKLKYLNWKPGYALTAWSSRWNGKAIIPTRM